MDILTIGSTLGFTCFTCTTFTSKIKGRIFGKYLMYETTDKTVLIISWKNEANGSNKISWIEEHLLLGAHVLFYLMFSKVVSECIE